MKDFLARILFYTALSMLLLHMVVPHVHAKSTHAQFEHELQEMDQFGFASFLKQIFHVDLGSDHLSNFNKASQHDLLLLVYLVSAILLFLVGWKLIKKQKPVYGTIVYKPVLYSADINSRPPPFLK